VIFVYQRAPIIMPTKCAFLISTNIKWASPTCFGTCVPSSEKTHCQFVKKTANVRITTLRSSHCCSGKATILHSLCVFVVLGIQHAVRMHLGPAPLHNIFPHYLIKGTIFEKKRKLLNIKCVFRVSLQLSSETCIILRRIQRDMKGNVNWSSCKVPFINVRF
jgi:hypothetical protein